MKKTITILFFALLGITSINAQCSAGFTFVVNPLMNGDVAFTNTSSGGIAGSTTYVWSYGDGTSFSSLFGNNPNHTYGNGTWYVCLTMVDSSTSCTSTFCDSVTVINNSISGCNASFIAYDSASYGYFIDMSSGTGLTYLWDFGDGSNSSTVGSTTHLYGTNGTYYVCLTISNTFLGCSNTYCDSVNIGTTGGGGNGGTCSASFSSANDTIGNGVTFTSTVTGTADTYFWNFGDGATSTQPNPYHVYGSTGTYTACLTVTSSIDTACAFTTCQPIIPGMPIGGCSANFVIVQDTSNLYNYWVYSYANNGLFTNYLWSFGDGTSSTSAYPTHLYSGTGPYYLCLTITDSVAGGLCTATYCDSIFPGHGVSQTTTLNVYPASALGVHESGSIDESLTNYPNPFTNTTTISYTTKQNSPIELTVLDLLGNKIALIETGSKSSGKHKIEFDASGIAAGIYMLQLKADNKVTTKKLVITK